LKWTPQDSFGFIHENGAFERAVDPHAPNIDGVVRSSSSGNDWNQVAGFYVKDAAGDTAGFIYNHGVFTSVTVPDATSVTATDINDLGEVSGFFTAKDQTEGFVDLNGKFTVLSHSGWLDVQALGLNNVGPVVGSYVDSNGNTDGFVYNSFTHAYKTIIEGAGTETVVNGVNDWGQLVGFLDSPGHAGGLLLTQGPHG
jgi:hypothetical protein